MPFIAKASARIAREVDRILCKTALNPPQIMRLLSTSEVLDPVERIRTLDIIRTFYGQERHFETDSTFFAQPAPIHPHMQKRRKLGTSGEVLDLSWPSEFVPLWSRRAVVDALPPSILSATAHYDLHMNALPDRSGELVEKYLRVKRNTMCHARWFRHHQGNRPCVVFLHGYLAGEYLFEERLWPVRKLFDAGYDVVLGVLPFHGLRRSETRGLLPPSFPSGDPRFTIEGFRQTVFDKRALFDFLHRAGAPSVGVMGMSLGGYASALLATLDARLDFAVLFIPLASIEDFAHRHGRFVGTRAQQQAQREGLRDAQWVVSPFARPSLLPQGRVLVIAGESDLVTGKPHAEPLAAHFDTHMELFHGGHVLPFGRDEAFKAVWRLLHVS
jgi:pimeloyl-ACP methyl ester carboxylesterase